MGHNSEHAPLAVASDFDDFRLLDVEVLLFFKGVLHQNVVKSPVLLVPKAVHRRTFAEVEHPALNHHFVRRLRHLATEGVDFPDKMTFRRAADGRVAGHIGDFVEIERKNTGFCAEARRRKGRLDPGVTRADDGNVVFSREVFFHFKILYPEKI